MNAVGYADETSFQNLKNIVLFLYNNVPSKAYGSKAKMHAWAKDRQKE